MKREMNKKIIAKTKDLWEEFGAVPMDPETECIEEPWRDFPAGTHREEVWHWFEETYGVSVAEDLMGIPARGPYLPPLFHLEYREEHAGRLPSPMPAETGTTVGECRQQPHPFILNGWGLQKRKVPFL